MKAPLSTPPTVRSARIVGRESSCRARRPFERSARREQTGRGRIASKHSGLRAPPTALRSPALKLAGQHDRPLAPTLVGDCRHATKGHRILRLDQLSSFGSSAGSMRSRPRDRRTLLPAPMSAASVTPAATDSTLSPSPGQADDRTAATRAVPDARERGACAIALASVGRVRRLARQQVASSANNLADG